MTPITQRVVLIPFAISLGCGLADEEKKACEVPSDCLDGLLCRDKTCVDPSDLTLGDPDDRSPDRPDHDDSSTGAPNDDKLEFGQVEAFVAKSAGLAVVQSEPLVGVTTAPAPLGCALVGDETASPGTAAALVYAKLTGTSGDNRCPVGVHGIMNDPDRCNARWGSLPDGCVRYKRWNSAGKLVATRLATGGYISVTDHIISSFGIECAVEGVFHFPGGITIEKTFRFAIAEYSPDYSFCSE